MEGVTHNYFRHDTTTLFAALDVATGKVLTHCRTRYRHQVFLGFLRQIEKTVQADLEVHLVVDKTCTHTRAKISAWLAQVPYFHVHLRLLAESGGALVRDHHAAGNQEGSFASVKELIVKIKQIVAANNMANPSFNWTVAADSIPGKLQRLCSKA